MAASISLLYFAWVRECVGRSEETLSIPDSAMTVAALTRWLISQGPGYAAAFAATGRVRCAVNQCFATAATAITAGDEVAFFPPFTGG